LFANIAYGVVFRNTSLNPLLITNVQYVGELWRTNATTTPVTAETWTTYFKTSPSPIVDTEPGASSATPNAGTFTKAPASLDWSSPTNTPPQTGLNGNLPANRMLVSGNLNTTVLPGEYFMFRWVDTNLANADGYQGIDDLSITVENVPEPATAGLLLAGGMSLLARPRRRSLAG
jgi:hypothetical protein